jgi:NAD(P) transhydrogenase
MSEHFDLVVIGAGPAGEKGAAQAAYFGKKVCLVERAPKPGGTAVNSGTLSARTLRETALVFSGLRKKGLYGVEFLVRPDLTIADFMHRERQVVETSWQVIEENLERHQITTVQGAAHFTDPRTLEVARHGQETRQFTADAFLVATGSHPGRPAEVPFDGSVVIDSDDVLSLQAIPARMVIIGGGVMGCEFASIFGALGVKVTIVERQERLLADFDHDVSDTLRQEFTRQFGIQAHLGLDVTSIEVREGLGHVLLADGTTLFAECVLHCAGRQGNTADLGLVHAGVATDAHGFIQVDDKFRSSITHIYAAGDVIGFPGLASTSMEQARVAVCHAFDLKYKQAVSRFQPFSIWTIPEVATVGLSEHEARAQDLAVETGKTSFRANARAQILGETEGFMKLIFRRDDQRLLGAAIVGENACELIHLASAVLGFGGTIDYFIQAVFSYPTLTDAYKYAAYDGLQRLQKRIRESGGMRATTDG